MEGLEELKVALTDEMKALLASDAEERTKLAERLTAVEKAWEDRVNEAMPGYGDKENKERFSLPEFLRFAATKGNDRYAKRERSLIEEFDKKTGCLDRYRVTRAAMGTTPDTLGGYLVPTELLGSEFIGTLEANVVVRRLGARSLVGLRGSPVEIPKKTAGATAYYTAENDAIIESDLQLGQVKMTPRELGAAVRYSRQLLMQSIMSVDAMIRDDIALRFALKEDWAALKGVGPNTPTGIITDANVPTQSMAAAITLDKFMDFENVVAEANALQGKLGFVLRPASWNVTRKLKDLDGRYQLQPDPTGATPRSILGHAVETTTQLAAAEMIFGNWDDLVIGMWEAIEFAVTTEGENTFLKNQALIRGLMLHDIALRQAASFVKATDFNV